MRFAVGVAMDGAFHRLRHDLGRAVVAVGMLDQAADQERHVHHQALHRRNLLRGKFTPEALPSLPAGPHLPTTSPKRTHSLPSKRCSWPASIGAKSSDEVLIATPGSSVPTRKPLMLAAWRITFSRVRLSPHCRSTCAIVSPTE